MKEGGHDVKFILNGWVDVLRMLERVVFFDEIRKNIANGNLMTKQEKIYYMTAWKRKRDHLLNAEGLMLAKGVVPTDLLTW